MLLILKARFTFSTYGEVVDSTAEFAWVRNPDGHTGPGRSLQGGLYDLFARTEVCRDIAQDMAQKLVVTLGEELSENIRLPANWYQNLVAQLPAVKTHTAMCVLKTYVGGWTTSHRMHDSDGVKPCIYGCTGERDTLVHYLVCPALWQISCAAIGVDVPIDIGARLGLIDPVPERLRALALLHVVPPLQGESQLVGNTEFGQEGCV